VFHFPAFHCAWRRFNRGYWIGFGVCLLTIEKNGDKVIVQKPNNQGVEKKSKKG